MKSKLPQIPNPKSKRKASPIIGRGAWATKSSSARPPLFEATTSPKDQADNADVVVKSDRKNSLKRPRKNARKQASAKESPAKASRRRTSKVTKVLDAEITTPLVHASCNSSGADVIAHLFDGSVNADMSSGLGQQPLNASPSRKSRKRRSSSLLSLALEESTLSPESAKRSAQRIPLSKGAVIALAHFQKIFAKHFRILAAAAVFILLLAGFLFGKLQSKPTSELEERELAKPSPQLVQEINEALALIEKGQPSKALQKIQALSIRHPNVSSLDYLASLAAMQAGDFKTAQEKASLSITKNQKVSDSLVLLSMTESGLGAGGKSSLRDPKIVRESLLREAVNADVANPFPMIELASFLRSQRRDEEALELLRAANARLHPIDTHVVVQTSMELMKLQQMPDEELPAARAEGSICEIFSSVYISLRRKDYKQAALALEKGRRQASPDLFAYLINDPVFKPFQAEPVMTTAL